MTVVQDSDIQWADDDSDSLISGEAVAIDLRPTGFVLRGAGLIIDWLVYFVGGTLLLSFVILPLLTAAVGKDGDAQTAVTLVTVVVVLIVVPLVVELLSHGKSLGKLAVGARIVRDDGGAIGFRQAFIRSMVGFFEIYVTFGGGAVVCALLNSRTKRIGDLLAGTYSQYERTSRIVEAPFFIPPQLQTWSRTADVGRIPDRLARRISQYLRQAPALTPAAHARVSAQLAAEVSPWVYPNPEAEPDALLAAVLALRRQREYAALLLEKERLTPLTTALTGVPRGFPDR
ncbi:MAG TPA: RDD family protein [Galbitalea sp.]|jgi:uncharacterized RDD family membrane protein YckC|nr:RDD family protein [Galbitalea sp.]